MDSRHSPTRPDLTDPADRWRKLWQELERLQDQLVQQIRLADRKQGSLDQLKNLTSASAKLALLEQIDNFMKDLMSQKKDANLIADFLTQEEE